jgi:predicted nucleotidyltransferase
MPKTKLNFLSEIKKLSFQIQKKYSPEKIILFGSCARGDYDEYSDIDMVIIKDTNRRFLDRIKDILGICDYSIAFEPLVYTPVEFKEMSEWNVFIKNILEEGKVIYERK